MNNIEVFTKKYQEKHHFKTPTNLEDIYNFFNKLNNDFKRGDRLGQVVALYLYKQIDSKDKRKRKVTARVFEDFIATFLNGEVTDKEKRENFIPDNFYLLDDFLVRYIVSNRREKVDIAFNSTQYGVSVKTSVEDNKEINMGSFAREALFKDILSKDEYGSERKGGLGSKVQILEKLHLIKSKGLYKRFIDRFELMVTSIFVDDFIYIIKGENYLSFNFLSGKDLQNLLNSSIKKSPEDAITILNRYEGNSIRIDRTKILENSKNVYFDFSETDELPIYKLNQKLEDMGDQILMDIIHDNTKELKQRFDLIEKFTNQYF